MPPIEQGAVPEENARCVRLPDGDHALCLAYADGAQSASIWKNTGFELDWVRGGRREHRSEHGRQDCDGLTSRPDAVVRQAFAGTGHEQHWVAEAWAVVGEATTVWGSGLGRNKNSASKPPRPH